MDRDAVVTELNTLRQEVSGITDTLVAGVDGLLIVADTEDRIDPEAVSALAAAQLSLAHTTASTVGQGVFRQAVVYSSCGCLAVYSVRRVALMVVLGDEGLDTTRLHRVAQPAIEHIGSILATPTPAA